MAKKVVRAAQEKSRKAREKLKNDSEVVFTSQKVVTKIIFEGITLTNHVIPTGLLLPVIFGHRSKWEQS